MVKFIKPRGQSKKTTLGRVDKIVGSTVELRSDLIKNDDKRTIPHEIGHLLGAEHAENGIMAQSIVEQSAQESTKIGKDLQAKKNSTNPEIRNKGLRRRTN